MTENAQINVVQIHGVNDVRLDTVPKPSVGPEDILVRVEQCGICGSDLGYIAMGGLTPPGIPMPIGHELAGTIEAVGDRVTHLSNGMRVTVNPMANRHQIGNGGTEGGFAPALLVRDVVNHPDAVLSIPEHLSTELAALIEPLAVALHGVNQGNVRADQKVLILGAGPIGLCTIIALRHRGVSEIVIADKSEKRLSIAQELGAMPCHVDEKDLSDFLMAQHGKTELFGMSLPGTDVLIEATGLGPVLEQAINLAKANATVVVVGVHKAPITLDPLFLLMKELTIVGSQAYPNEFPEVIEFVASGKFDLHPLISHRFPLSQFNEALRVAQNPNQAAKVLIDCQA